MTNASLVGRCTGRSAGFVPVKILSSIVSNLAQCIKNAGAVIHEAAAGCESGPGISRWHTMARRKRDDLITVATKQWVDADHQRIRLLTSYRCESNLDFGTAARVHDSQMQAELTGRALQLLRLLGRIYRISRIDQQSDHLTAGSSSCSSSSRLGATSILR